MAQQVELRFKYPTEDNLRFMERLGLSYAEMGNCYDIKRKKSYIEKLFKKYGIYHKCVWERVKDEIIANNDKDKSIAFLSIKYKCSKTTIKKVKRWFKEYDKNINN